MKLFKIKTLFGWVNIWTGDFQEIATDIQKRHPKIDISEILHPGTLGACFRLETEQGDGICMILISEPDNQIIYHECLHAAWYALDNAGVQIDVNNHEVLTYLQGYLVENIKKRL